MGVIVVAVVCVPRRSRWCRGRACYGAQSSANCRTNARAMTPARDGADHRSGAGPKQSAGNGALAGIVRVRVGRRRQQQSRANHGGNTQWLSHFLLSPLSHRAKTARPALRANCDQISGSDAQPITVRWGIFPLLPLRHLCSPAPTRGGARFQCAPRTISGTFRRRDRSVNIAKSRQTVPNATIPEDRQNHD
jgi:hypothetical protein